MSPRKEKRQHPYLTHHRFSQLFIFSVIPFASCLNITILSLCSLSILISQFKYHYAFSLFSLFSLYSLFLILKALTFSPTLLSLSYSILFFSLFNLLFLFCHFLSLSHSPSPPYLPLSKL